MKSAPYISWQQIVAALPRGLELSEHHLRNLGFVREGNERLWLREDICTYLRRKFRDKQKLVQAFCDSVAKSQRAQQQAEDDTLTDLNDHEQLDLFSDHELGLFSKISFVQALTVVRLGAPFLVYRGDDKRSASRNLETIKDQYRNRDDDWRLLGGVEGGLWVIEFCDVHEMEFLEDDIGPLTATWTLSNDSGGLIVIFRRMPLEPERQVDAPLWGTRAVLRDSAPLPNGFWRWHPFLHPQSFRPARLSNTWITLLPRIRTVSEYVAEETYEE